MARHEISDQQMSLGLRFEDMGDQPVSPPLESAAPSPESFKATHRVKDHAIVYINGGRYGWTLLSEAAVRPTGETRGRFKVYEVCESVRIYRDQQYKTLVPGKIFTAPASVVKPL